MAMYRNRVSLLDASFHPPSVLRSHSDDLIPWVILENKAYVADHRNDTTAHSPSRSGKHQIQVTLCFARPPLLSHICVFCRDPAAYSGGCGGGGGSKIVAREPQILATEGDLVLLRIFLHSDEGYELRDVDLYIYRPGGRPSLTLLERPPGNHIFYPDDVGLLINCHRSLSFQGDSSSYMVAALCGDELDRRRGSFVLYLYDSKLKTWTTTTVSLETQQFHKYQQNGWFLHRTRKVITIGGDAGTMGFVDLWQGILLCDLLRVQDVPTVRYIPLPHPLRMVTLSVHVDDARYTRDIALVRGRIRLVRMLQSPEDSWMAYIWSRPAYTLPFEDSWQVDYEMDFSKMNIGAMEFELLANLHGSEDRPLTPFKGRSITRPTLSLDGDDDATVCFMVESKHQVGKASVVSVDMRNNRLQGVGLAIQLRFPCSCLKYLHSRVTKYLKNVPGAGKPETTTDGAAWIRPQQADQLDS